MCGAQEEAVSAGVIGSMRHSKARKAAKNEQPIPAVIAFSIIVLCMYYVCSTRAKGMIQTCNLAKTGSGS